MRAHIMRNNIQILLSDQSRYRENFTRSTANADARFACGSYTFLFKMFLYACRDNNNNTCPNPSVL